jgi:hypothetical protein
MVITMAERKKNICSNLNGNYNGRTKKNIRSNLNGNYNGRTKNDNKTNKCQ